MPELTDERAEANALLKRARELGDDEALEVYDEIVARFRESSRIDVQERVALALLRKGLALDRLDRHDEEIQAYDEVLRLFSASDDPKTVLRVAWAMYDRAVALHSLDREEDAAAGYQRLVDRFRDADEPGIRPRVSWSLWWLFMLGRRSEEEICRELVGRGDDELESDLRDRVMFAYCTLGALAHRRGEVEEALRLFDETVARAGAAPDADELVQVVNALLQKAYVLEQLNRHDDAIAVYDELIPRLDESSQKEQAVDARRRRAVALDWAGRSTEAVDAYDDALRLAAEDSAPGLREQAFRTLASKGLTLRNLRRDEALVVVNSALGVYSGLHPDVAADVRPIAVRALIEKLQLLCELDRSEEAGEVERALLGMLGDVVAPALAGRAAKPPDNEIAALLAELHRSDCWTLFETPPPPDSDARFEAMALELYRRTDPLLQAPIDDWDGSAVAAAMIIRQVADGFALLSEPSDSTRLALPQRRLLEWAMRLAGVDEWAADQGHPLELAEDSDDIRELVDAQPEPDKDYSDDCAAACVAAFYQRDIIAALSDSPTGQQVLHSSTHRWLAARHLNTARSWGGWAFANGDDAQPATAAAILVAQAYYRASRENISSADLTPSRETLDELLRHADGRRWLEDRDFVLPDWLTAED